VVGVNAILAQLRALEAANGVLVSPDDVQQLRAAVLASRLLFVELKQMHNDVGKADQSAGLLDLLHGG
jgi:hypothetical protein